MITMRWGKYRGRRIEDIPSGYLKWLAENARDEVVARNADEEWRWREDHNAHFEDD